MNERARQLSALRYVTVRRREWYAEIDRRVLSALRRRPTEALSVNEIVDDISGRYRATIVFTSLVRIVRRGQAIAFPPPSRNKSRRYQATLPAEQCSVPTASGATDRTANASHE